jgi:hypothetical protein
VYAVDSYRRIIARRERATTADERNQIGSIAAWLRRQWEYWQGEDSLHEMAFGEPVE